MKKADRITAFVEKLGTDPGLALDPRYQAYFRCFNERRYYEAHDVLENLWLQGPDENHRFFKGLIQVAGAFVHLQKQFLRPAHPKDGRRLRPAVRLFHLALTNLELFRPRHMQLDVEGLCVTCSHLAAEIASKEFTHNPWHPGRPPQLCLSAV
jgi:hypothetical protein